MDGLWNGVEHCCIGSLTLGATVPPTAIVEETLTSDEYIYRFLISILNMYICNFNIYVPIHVLFKEKCTNCQPEKITQVKRTNAPFLLLFFT